MKALPGQGTLVTSNRAVPPPPVTFIADAGRLARIREQITEPPDPAILHWVPPPDYDSQTVAVRIRLERSAEAREAPPPPTRPVLPGAPTGRSAEPSARPEGVFRPGEAVDFSSSAQLQNRIRVESRPASATRPPAGFGEVQSAQPSRKEADKVRRRGFSDEDLVARLKQDFMKRDKPEPG